jgi:transposase IS66 family protein
MLDTLDIDPDQITDPVLRGVVTHLLNVIEDLHAEVERLQAENQRLRDENARLKGGSGRPTPRPSVARPPATNYSSERERHVPRRHHKTSKVATLTIDRVVDLAVPAARLPPDAVCKGYEEVVVQDVRLQVETICFRKAKWYSPTTHRTYLAALPPGYRGQCGPGVRTLAVSLHQGGQMSQTKVLGFLRDLGVVVSAGWLATELTAGQEPFHAEARAVIAAGVASSPWHYLDETSTRVDGGNRFCHVLGNDLYTAFRTPPHKDRQAVVDVLWPEEARRYCYDAVVVAVLETAGVATRTRQTLTHLPRDAILAEAEFDAWLDAHLPRVGVPGRKPIRDALRVAAYRARSDGPVVRLLLTDDAPQFGGVTEAHALCWIHVGRHFKQLTPALPHHRRVLTRFLRRFWRYYHQLAAYRAAPRAAPATRLARGFDQLFATTTGYAQLDARIAQTRAQKTQVLQVLTHPELPLHTNGAELGARQRVRKRDVSFGPRSEAGLHAWDTFQTLAATAAKLGVSFHAYVHDRISETNALPSLAEVITERARTARLGASWATTQPSPTY